jgi:hypothetical protein
MYFIVMGELLLDFVLSEQRLMDGATPNALVQRGCAINITQFRSADLRLRPRRMGVHRDGHWILGFKPPFGEGPFRIESTCMVAP